MFGWRQDRTRSDCTLAASAARGPSSRYWLIVKNHNGPLEALTVDLEGQETIPVFSFREEAELYVRFEAWDGWTIRETSAGELAHLLFDPYLLHVKMVALDPLPEICDEGMTQLVSVRRKDFAIRLSLGGRGMRSAPAVGSTTQTSFR